MKKDVCLNFIFPLKSILILGGTQKLSFQVGISRVEGPEILGGTLNPPAHYATIVTKRKMIAPKFFVQVKLKIFLFIQSIHP